MPGTQCGPNTRHKEKSLQQKLKETFATKGKEIVTPNEKAAKALLDIGVTVNAQDSLEQSEPKPESPEDEGLNDA